MCGRRKEMMLWPGLIQAAKRLRSRNLRFSKQRNAIRTLRPSPRQPNHHDLVRDGVQMIAREEKSVGGQLGRPSGARFRTYERSKTLRR